MCKLYQALWILWKLKWTPPSLLPMKVWMDDLSKYTQVPHNLYRALSRSQVLTRKWGSGQIFLHTSKRKQVEPIIHHRNAEDLYKFVSRAIHYEKRKIPNPAPWKWSLRQWERLWSQILENWMVGLINSLINEWPSVHKGITLLTSFHHPWASKAVDYCVNTTLQDSLFRGVCLDVSMGSIWTSLVTWK